MQDKSQPMITEEISVIDSQRSKMTPKSSSVEEDDPLVPVKNVGIINETRNLIYEKDTNLNNVEL